MTPEEIVASVADIEILYAIAWQSLMRTSGSHRSRFQGAGFRFKKIGEWEESRTFRRMNYRATLRAMKAQFPIFEEDKAVDVVGIIDATPSVRRFGRPPKLVREAQLAAAFSKTARIWRDTVTLIAYSDTADILLWRERMKQLPLLAAQAILEYAPAGQSGRGIREVPALLPRTKSFIFWISDFLPSPRDFEEPLSSMLEIHDVVPIVIRDRWEIDMPSIFGIVPEKDSETGQEVDIWISPASQTRFRKSIEENLAKLYEFFGSLEIEPLVLLPGMDLIEALDEYFLYRVG